MSDQGNEGDEQTPVEQERPIVLPDYTDWEKKHVDPNSTERRG